MKITFEEGTKVKGDKRIIIETNGKEQLDMIEVAYLINQFALNELLIIDKKPNLNRKDHNWFPNVLVKAFKDAEEGIDWKDCNEKIIRVMENTPFHIPKESIDKFLGERK